MCWRVVFLFIEFDSAYCVGLLNGSLTFQNAAPKQKSNDFLTPILKY